MADYLSRHHKKLSKVDVGTQTDVTGKFAGSHVEKCRQLTEALDRDRDESTEYEGETECEFNMEGLDSELGRK